MISTRPISSVTSPGQSRRLGDSSPWGGAWRQVLSPNFNPRVLTGAGLAPRISLPEISPMTPEEDLPFASILDRDANGAICLNDIVPVHRASCGINRADISHLS
jgi:hypothetical protein